MTNLDESIIDSTDRCIDDLCAEYKAEPTLFYTENDLTCRLYWMLMNSGCDLQAVDKSGKKHLLIHTEYPTPFRCEMKDNTFRVAHDDSEDRRGHYDLVVLNPALIRSHCYSDVYGQSFEHSKRTIMVWSKTEGPLMLYGVEIMLRRKPLSGSKKFAARSWTTRMAKFQQDCDKLLASQKDGLMKKTQGIYFIREHNSALENFILERNPSNGRICWG